MKLGFYYFFARMEQHNLRLMARGISKSDAASISF